ncbi:MAG: MFS transporter, partial [bacterium]|nr:MFS transporter [bacterium]
VNTNFVKYSILVSSPLQNILRAFAHRNYRFYWTGHAISLIGTWMQTLAQGWLVWQMTESPFWLGIVSAMSQLPSLLFGSFGGVLVDRAGKRKLLLITQAGLAVSAAVMAFITLAGFVQLWHIVLIATLSGLFAAVDAPARLSFIQDLVGKEDLGNAVALNSSTFNGARLVGPAIAGLLVPIVGEGGCFLLNSLSYAALIIALLQMKELPHTHKPTKSVFHEWHEAFNFIRHSPIHRTLILNTLVFGAFGFAYTVLMPVFADKILEIGVRGLGMLMGTIGVGALFGGLWQASLPNGAKRGRLVIGGAVGLAIGALGFSFSRSLPLSLVLLAFVGFAGISMLASTNTLLQSLAPDHLRGRVMGFYTTAFLGISPIGNFLVGSIASKLGASYAMAVVSLFCLLYAVTTIIWNPKLKSV